MRWHPRCCSTWFCCYGKEKNIIFKFSLTN
jgi:hypothetical protein